MGRARPKTTGDFLAYNRCDAAYRQPMVYFFSEHNRTLLHSRFICVVDRNGRCWVESCCLTQYRDDSPRVALVPSQHEIVSGPLCLTLVLVTR